MSWQTRGWAFGAAGLLLGLLISGDPGSAADDKDIDIDAPKELRAGIDKIAAALAKDKAADVAKDVAALKDFELKIVMRLFKVRRRGGLGVGDKPGVFKPDGIEGKLFALEEDELTAAELADQGDALKQLAIRVAAMAAVTEGRPPPKAKKKGVNPKHWATWSQEMKKATFELAAAVADKKLGDIKKAADAAGQACIRCHDGFRDDPVK